jgi:hypothetical protein
MTVSAAALILAALLPAQAPKAENPAPDAGSFRPAEGWKSLGTDLWFDPKERRLVIRARVCLRDGYLEHLLCSNRSKEHESILTTAAPPAMIQAGLILAGAEAGKPVQFQPEYRPPEGPSIRIELHWDDPQGRPQTSDARRWVKGEKSGQELAPDWVFAGSYFVDDASGRRRFAAEGGDLVTVSNFTSAILDVPIASSASDAERSFVAYTERIPPLETGVTLYLKPLPAKPAVPSAP